MEYAIVLSTAFLSEDIDIAAAPADSDRCLIPKRHWAKNMDKLFIRIITLTKKLMFRIGGWHNHPSPFDNAIYIPYWMMSNIPGINDFDHIQFEYITYLENIMEHGGGDIVMDAAIPDATRVILKEGLIADDPLYLLPAKKICIQAHSQRFLDVPDPKTWLHCALTNYSLVQEKTVVPLTYDHETFDFNVVSIEPKSRLKAVHLIDTDVEVEFIQPVDYVPPAPPVPIVAPVVAPVASVATPMGIAVPSTEPIKFAGVGNKLSDAPVAAPPPTDEKAKRALLADAMRKRMMGDKT